MNTGGLIESLRYMFLYCVKIVITCNLLFVVVYRRPLQTSSATIVTTFVMFNMMCSYVLMEYLNTHHALDNQKSISDSGKNVVMKKHVSCFNVNKLEKESCLPRVGVNGFMVLTPHNML